MERSESFTIEPPSVNEKTPSLYPERVIDKVPQIAAQLEALENGTQPLLELSEDERELILENEKRLGEKLELAYRISPRAPIFSPEYFLTPEGKVDFEKTTGIPFPPEVTTVEESVRFLFSTRHHLKNLKPEVYSKLSDRSLQASEKVLIASLTNSLDTEGNISFTNIPLPEKLSLPLTPEKTIEKIQLLFQLKKEIKSLRSKNEKESPFGKVNEGIWRLYQKRINTLLLDLKFSVLNLAALVREHPSLELSEDEEILLRAAKIFSPSDENISRYDRFAQGAARTTNEDGNYETLGGTIREFADEIEKEYTEIQLTASKAIREKGLDENKLKEPSLSVETVKKMGTEALAAYGVLSAYPAESYDLSETGPAPDGKWRFVLRPEYKTFSVDSKRKVVKGPARNFSVMEAIPISIAHETEGHMLQHENRSQLPLRIFKEVGAGRSDVLAECGAMNNEDMVSKQAFGIGSLGHPHYLRAMERRAEGGDYFECVEAFYRSAQKADKIMLSLGEISREEFIARSKKAIALAVNRTKRLFQSSTKYSSESNFLAKSKDTAYLEQIKLAREFHSRGLDKFIFIAGIDIDDLPFLVESGLLDARKIKAPIHHALKTWESIKDSYQLSPKENSPDSLH